MTRKIDVSLDHHRKLCSGKDRVAQLKSFHDKDIADKASKHLKDY